MRRLTESLTRSLETYCGLTQRNKGDPSGHLVDFGGKIILNQCVDNEDLLMSKKQEALKNVEFLV